MKYIKSDIVYSKCLKIKNKYNAKLLSINQFIMYQNANHQ
mgnify:CR=1 FL=1